MNTQIPKPYIVSVVAFALLIPLWVLSGVAKPRAEPERPAKEEKKVEPDKKSGPEPSRPIVVRFVNETDRPVKGFLKWRVPNAARIPAWDELSKPFAVPTKSKPVVEQVPAGAIHLEVASETTRVVTIPVPGPGGTLLRTEEFIHTTQFTLLTWKAPVNCTITYYYDASSKAPVVTANPRP